MADESSGDESRRKRVKISDDSVALNSSSEPVALPLQQPQDTSIPERAETLSSIPQAVKELEVGITHFISPELPGFTGILKKRYTDFLVNEILPSGEVLHLEKLDLPAVIKAAIEAPASDASQQPAEDPETPQEPLTVPSKIEEEEGNKEENQAEQPTFQLSAEDTVLLNEVFSEEGTSKLVGLYQRSLAKLTVRSREIGKVTTAVISDKDKRTSLHQSIRRIFNSGLDSTTDGNGAIVVSPVPVRQRGGKNTRQDGGNNRRPAAALARRGKLGWSEMGGEYLHFTIYKENKDTMEVLSYIGRQLKMGPKTFQFAGTKDRRGVTVQRASGFRLFPDRMVKMNASLRNAAIGDFEYKPYGLELGQLGGNEFMITLRECDFPVGVVGDGGKITDDTIANVKALVGKSLHDLRERGYMNYYGLQRFGTFSKRTDTTGVKMLRGEFKEACESILYYSQEALSASQGSGPKPLISSDDISRAEAIHIFETTGNSRIALDKLPKKFTAETHIIRHLSQRKNDHFGALQSIPRNLRLMYVHAYQSLVWNFVAGERWRLYGDKVVEGDLVLEEDYARQGNEPLAANPMEEVDMDGELIVLPDADDSGGAADDVYERARPLTLEDAASGKFSIFDVVLPLPGFDVLYPANQMKEFYKQFMASEKGGNLDPFNMRRKWRDISLSGGYRKLLSRPGVDYSFDVRAYSVDGEQFVQTDLEKLKEHESTRSKAEEQTQKEGDDDSRTEPVENADKLAVILKFQLGPSQYATMALRELMKTGGAKMYQAEFSGR